MTLEEKVRFLRIKIAEKRSGLDRYLSARNHDAKYRASLEGQLADFDYFLKELDRLLVADSEPVR